MKQLILPDDHDLCIRTFLRSIEELHICDQRKGVLHIGAHMGEEVAAYADHAYDPIYLVEANPQILPALTQRFENNASVQILSTAVGDAEGEVDFVVHKTAKGSMESSGLLDLEKLGEIVPTFNSDTRYRVPMTTVDRLAEDFDLSGRISLMVLDIQGAEMKALTSAHNLLHEVDAVICEVNLIRNYHECALEGEIDAFFESIGFIKHLAIYHELYDANGRFPAWGECLWLNARTPTIRNPPIQGSQ